MANEKGTTQDFGLTMAQKILYLVAPVVLSVVIIFLGPYMQTGWMGWALFLVLGILLGFVTFFLSAGWGYKLELTPSEVKINDKRVNINIPLDKIGLIVRNSNFPFPTIWIVGKNLGTGNEIPLKGVDPQARELIDNYQRRNPGKTLTYVPVPGAHIRSVSGFVSELKRRIPPVTVDPRFGVK